MGQVLSKDVPIFAGLSSLFPGGNDNSQMILSVVDEEKMIQARRLIEDVCGDFNLPGTGILFALPVNSIWGLAKEIS